MPAEEPPPTTTVLQENHQANLMTTDDNNSNQENQDFASPPSSKLLMESRDSIDSQISLSFDRKNSGTNSENGSASSSDEQQLHQTKSHQQQKQEQQEEDEGAHMADLSDSASDTGSHSGGKDSGCEVTPDPAEVPDEEPPFNPPTEDLAEKIVQQVEFYFSDANITKDAFLLKHVKRNKEGYVSLKLISSFKRVKHLTKDWRVVAHALLRSKKLEINEAGTKLRRLEPLPKYDETTPSRTVVAVHMPIDKPTIENVAELFGNCGEIALIRILRPGNPIPADVRQFINKNPSLAGMVCALVEFVHSESARRALQLPQSLVYNVQDEPLKVYELNNVPHPERKKKSNNSSKNNNKNSNLNGHNNNNNSNNRILSESSDYISSSCQSSSEAEDMIKGRMDPRSRLRRGSSAHFPSRYIEPAAWLQRRLSASSTEANFIYMPRRLSYSSRDSSDSSLFLSRRMSNCSLTGSGHFDNNAPYHHYNNTNNNNREIRRMSSTSQSSDCSSFMSGPSRSRSNSAAFQNHQEHVVRLPRGPDGSKGFGRQPSQGCITRPLTAGVAQ